MEQEYQRRADDRERELNTRLSHLERSYEELQGTVLKLDATINVVKLEQSHIKELFDARLKTIEKGQELQVAELKGIGVKIEAMASEAEKTPMGRMIVGHISDVQQELGRHETKLNDVQAWQTRVDGVLLMLKFMGASGVAALAVALLRMFHVFP